MKIEFAKSDRLLEQRVLDGKLNRIGRYCASTCMINTAPGFPLLPGVVREENILKKTKKFTKSISCGTIFMFQLVDNEKR